MKVNSTLEWRRLEKNSDDFFWKFVNRLKGLGWERIGKLRKDAFPDFCILSLNSAFLSSSPLDTAKGRNWKIYLVSLSLSSHMHTKRRVDSTSTSAFKKKGFSVNRASDPFFQFMSLFFSSTPKFGSIEPPRQPISSWSLFPSSSPFFTVCGKGRLHIHSTHETPIVHLQRKEEEWKEWRRTTRSGAPFPYKEYFVPHPHFSSSASSFFSREQSQVTPTFSPSSSPCQVFSQKKRRKGGGGKTESMSKHDLYLAFFSFSFRSLLRPLGGGGWLDG